MTRIRSGSFSRAQAGPARQVPDRPTTAADTTEAISESLTPSLEAQESTLEGIEHQLTLLVDRVMNSLYPSTLGALRVDISPNTTVNAVVNNIGNLNPTAFMHNMQYQVSYTLRANIVTT